MINVDFAFSDLQFNPTTLEGTSCLICQLFRYTINGRIVFGANIHMTGSSFTNIGLWNLKSNNMVSQTWYFCIFLLNSLFFIFFLSIFCFAIFFIFFSVNFLRVSQSPKEKISFVFFYFSIFPFYKIFSSLKSCQFWWFNRRPSLFSITEWSFKIKVKQKFKWT